MNEEIDVRRFFVVVSLLILPVGCSDPGATWMKGKLIYAPGNGIYELDLETRKETALTRFHGRYDALSNLDSRHLLVDTHGEPPSKIQVMDRGTVRFRDLRSGYSATYMPRHRKFFFFQSSTTTGPRLYLADVDRPTDGVKQVAKDKGEFSSYSYVFAVSEDEVVFPIRGDAGKTPPYRYNLVTDTLEQVSLNRQCTPYIWRSLSRQILCGVDGTHTYYLVSLDGQSISPVDLSGLPSKRPIPLLYISKYDVLILTVAQFAWIGRSVGEHFDLWAYWFKDGRSEKLVEDNGPGRGSIVWVEE